MGEVGSMDGAEVVAELSIGLRWGGWVGPRQERVLSSGKRYWDEKGKSVLCMHKIILICCCSPRPRKMHDNPTKDQTATPIHCPDRFNPNHPPYIIPLQRKRMSRPRAAPHPRGSCIIPIIVIASSGDS